MDENEKKGPTGKLTRTDTGISGGASGGKSLAAASVRTVRAGAGKATHVEVAAEIKERLKAELEITPAEFRQAEFAEAEFRAADFKPADYKPSEFMQAQYRPAEFRQAEFRQSEFKPAEFRQATFKPAEYSGGEYHPAEFRPAVYVPAQYKPAAFRPAAFRPATFKPAQYTPAIFKQAQFKPAEFKPAEFAQASYVPAEFHEAEYTPAQYQPSEFSEGKFQQAAFVQSTHKDPQLKQAEFTPAAYSPADYHEAAFKQAAYKPSDFKQAAYRPSDFHQADFHQASFRPARFKPAEFKDAHIEGLGAVVTAEGTSVPHIDMWEQDARSPEEWRTAVEAQEGRRRETAQPDAVVQKAQIAQSPQQAKQQTSPQRQESQRYLEGSLQSIVNGWLAQELSALETYELAADNTRDGDLHRGLVALLEGHKRRAQALHGLLGSVGVHQSRSPGPWAPLALSGRVAASETYVMPELLPYEQRMAAMYEADLGSKDPAFRSWVLGELVPEQRRAVELCRQLTRYVHQ